MIPMNNPSPGGVFVPAVEKKLKSNVSYSVKRTCGRLAIYDKSGKLYGRRGTPESPAKAKWDSTETP